MKFRKGLQHDIQDMIAQLAQGRPDDANPLAWYEAALTCAENQESNALFHGASRAPSTTSSFWNFTMAPTPSTPAPLPRFPTFATPVRVPQNPVPMDIDTAKKKGLSPEVCY